MQNQGALIEDKIVFVIVYDDSETIEIRDNKTGTTMTMEKKDVPHLIEGLKSFDRTAGLEKAYIRKVVADDLDANGEVRAALLRNL